MKVKIIFLFGEIKFYFINNQVIKYKQSFLYFSFHNQMKEICRQIMNFYLLTVITLLFLSAAKNIKSRVSLFPELIFLESNGFNPSQQLKLSQAEEQQVYKTKANQESLR